jgi:cephalosporin-C deacetylase-like acetyl esterase
MATEGYKNVALNWIRAGYSVLGMDSRLQGGKSIDNAIYEYSNYGLVVFLLWILLKKLAFNCII